MRTRKFMLVFVLLCFLILSVCEASVNWPVWDNDTPYPHTVFGEPTYNKHDPNHNAIRKYGAFTVYYDDEVLSPRWTAIKMTHHVADKNNHIEREARFKTDKTLEQKGFKVTTHDDYKNPEGVRKWNRGHMVQFDDARGYGEKAAEESFYTSNVCPQLAEHNQRGWLTLEETCTEFARDYGVVWIYSGPIYDEHKEPFVEDHKIPRPIAFYKVVISPREDEWVNVLAFRMPHEPIPRDVDLSECLVSIRDIEQETELNFLHKLPDDIENIVETTVWEIWPDPCWFTVGFDYDYEFDYDYNYTFEGLSLTIGPAPAIMKRISIPPGYEPEAASEIIIQALNTMELSIEEPNLEPGESLPINKDIKTNEIEFDREWLSEHNSHTHRRLHLPTDRLYHLGYSIRYKVIGQELAFRIQPYLFHKGLAGNKWRTYPGQYSERFFAGKFIEHVSMMLLLE